MPQVDSRFAYPGWAGPFVTYSDVGTAVSADYDYVIFDVETTGFDPAQGDRMLEVCAIRANGRGEVLGSFSSLLNAGVDDVGAEHIHGISLAMLQDAPTFGEVFDQIVPLMQDAIFVAHHAKFDESFIAAEAALAGIALTQMPGLCTYWLARQTVQETDNHKLATLAQHFNLDTGTAHSAADDAFVVVQMLPTLLQRIPGIHLTTPLSQQLHHGKYAQALTR